LGAGFEVEGKKIYLRPGCEKFLSGLMRHPRIKLAFYTSLKWEDAAPILENFNIPNLCGKAM
jgi:hypothetical protein